MRYDAYDIIIDTSASRCAQQYASRCASPDISSQHSSSERGRQRASAQGMSVFDGGTTVATVTGWGVALALALHTRASWLVALGDQLAALDGSVADLCRPPARRVKIIIYIYIYIYLGVYIDVYIYIWIYIYI